MKHWSSSFWAINWSGTIGGPVFIFTMLLLYPFIYVLLFCISFNHFIHINSIHSSSRFHTLTLYYNHRFRSIRAPSLSLSRPLCLKCYIIYFYFSSSFSTYKCAHLRANRTLNAVVCVCLAEVLFIRFDSIQTWSWQNASYDLSLTCFHRLACSEQRSPICRTNAERETDRKAKKQITGIRKNKWNESNKFVWYLLSKQFVPVWVASNASERTRANAKHANSDESGQMGE